MKREFVEMEGGERDVASDREEWKTGRKKIEDQYQCQPHPGLQGQGGEQHAAVVNTSPKSLIEKHAETNPLSRVLS